MNWQFWTFTVLYWLIQLLACIDHIKTKNAGILFFSLIIAAAFQALVTFAVLSGAHQ